MLQPLSHPNEIKTGKSRTGTKPFTDRQSSDHPEYSPSMIELGLEGYVLDTIDAIGSPHIIREQKAGSPFADILDGAVIIHLVDTSETITRHFGTKGKYFTGEDIEDVFWQTMIRSCTEAEFDTIREKHLSIRLKYHLYHFLYAVRLMQYRWVCAALFGYLLISVHIALGEIEKIKAEGPEAPRTSAHDEW
ncbi:hypothetical protein HD806DRAFT_535291 [Xylariaceae sp. AK1471]|nr:hypothetical protein HD806DRAFT_535291 [Xylariaceae sp. AK1471]